MLLFVKATQKLITKIGEKIDITTASLKYETPPPINPILLYSLMNKKFPFVQNKCYFCTLFWERNSLIF